MQGSRAADAMDRADVLKRPAAKTASYFEPNLSPQALDNLKTHLGKCTCGGKLSHGHKISASLVDLSGTYPCSYTSQRCTSNDCRLTYGPNYYWDVDSRKIKTASPGDLTNGILFISSKTAYTTSFLEYQSKILYRGSVSAASQIKAYKEVLDNRDLVAAKKRAQMNLGHALFY